MLIINASFVTKNLQSSRETKIWHRQLVEKISTSMLATLADGPHCPAAGHGKADTKKAAPCAWWQELAPIAIDREGQAPPKVQKHNENNDFCLYD